MARRRISVEKIKEVIRYGVTTELSERAIGRALKVSRTAVTKYLECFRGSGLTWEQAQELPDSELLAVLEGSRPARTSARYERLAERFPMMVKELRRKGVTLQLLWEEYLRAHPDGYQNSQFCYHFHRWRKSTEVSMHIDHKAGEKLFVDYAGDRLAIVDPEGGKEQPVETFVAILGASELTYVEASATQQGEDWIRSNERALRYCGGGTQVIVPDNLRSAVSRSDPYEPGINATFDAFAQHYGVVIMPARVRQARDKALVESAVRLTYQRIYAPLRDRAFHSLDELNAAIRPLLEQHNGRRFQRLPYSRRELFEQIERHTLAPLPQHHFPLQQTREVTVAPPATRHRGATHGHQPAAELRRAALGVRHRGRRRRSGRGGGSQDHPQGAGGRSFHPAVARVSGTDARVRFAPDLRGGRLCEGIPGVGRACRAAGPVRDSRHRQQRQHHQPEGVHAAHVRSPEYGTEPPLARTCRRRLRRRADRQPAATSNAVTLRVSRLNSTPMRWIGPPPPRYLAA